MRAAYIDESGRDDRFYFFGCLLVDDEELLAIDSSMDGIARLLTANVDGFSHATEFHGVDMFHGEGAWKGVPVAWRIKACELVSKVIARSGAKYIFRGIDMKRQRKVYPDAYPPHLVTLAHLLEDINDLMERIHGGVALVMADDHHLAASSRRDLRSFKLRSVPGYTNKRLSSIADTIYFGPSHESRLLQAVDVATFFLNRHRTITEKDPRAAAAVDRIAKNVRSVTVHEYVWEPTPRYR